MTETLLSYKAKGIRLESYIDPRKKIYELTGSQDLAIFTGTANIPLARKVARIIREDFGIAAGRFGEGEVSVQLPSAVDNRDVYIIQPTNPNADNIFELALMIDACGRADARRITVVIPYFGYARQDRKDAPRTPISARLATDIIINSGASRIVTVDIHAEQELGFTNKPFNNIYASKVQIPEILDLNLTNPCFVSVDKGGVNRTRAYARRTGLDENRDTATVLKQKDGDDTNALYLEGDVSGRDVAFIDDIVNSAKSLFSAIKLVKKEGASRILAFISHGMMFNRWGYIDADALDRITYSPIEALYLTDTVRQPPDVKNHPKIRIISVAPLLAEAIIRLHVGKSLSPDLVD